jgi:rapamycin-insensitive companion of mTOR
MLKEQALPRLFSVAMDFSNLSERASALSALSSMDSLNRNQAKSVEQQASGGRLR